MSQSSIKKWEEMLTSAHFIAIATDATPKAHTVKLMWTLWNMTHSLPDRDNLKAALKEFYIEQGGDPGVADIVNAFDD